METRLERVNAKSLGLAKDLISRGELVAFGTETVYGLGADAFNPAAAKKVYLAKRRPMDNPLIVHLDSVEKIHTVARCPAALLEKLAKVMPAPLTVVLPKHDRIPYETTAGLETVGVRVPRCLAAREFLRAVNTPIAAPSANKSTRPSPTTAQHVLDDFRGEIPLILDMGAAEVGVESTVLDMTVGVPCVLRLGGMTVEELCETFGKVRLSSGVSSDTPRAPGMKYRHYAPRIPVYIFEEGDFGNAAEAYRHACARGEKPVILALEECFPHFEGMNLSSLGFNDISAANLLFFRLRALENLYDEIITFRLPGTGLGRAFNNRIEKAAARE